MKIVKLVFAVLVGLYAVAQAVVLVLMLSGKKEHAPIMIPASAGILCLAAGISLTLFKSAFKTPAGAVGPSTKK